MNPQVPVGALQHKYCKFYQLQFPVLMEKCTALLCSETIQEMDLNQVRFAKNSVFRPCPGANTADYQARYQVPGCI